MTYRGSRKHVLDLLAGSFAPTMTTLLGPSGVSVDANDVHVPKGPHDASECTIRAFARDHLRSIFDFDKFDQWWVPDQYRNPQWDLQSTCTIDGAPGLLLVEAKANESELQSSGKADVSDPSPQSKANHERICECIAEMGVAIEGALGEPVMLSVTSKYQLANRIASAWRLAECGLPVALLYLGFTGDTYFGVGTLRDDAHWLRAMRAYLDGTVPRSLHGRIVPVGERGSFRLLVKSHPVSEVSV